MTKELATISTDQWQAMKEQAGVLVKSGFLPPSVRTAEQALSIAMAGKELGIGFMESIRSINVIQGKPTISPQLMLALANKTKELEDISIDSNAERCIVTIKRVGRKAHKEEFGVKEATALGLINRDNYNKQRATMFKWRALAANLRISFPDVVLGLYTPEEMGADVVDKDGEMRVVEAVVVSTPPEIKKVETKPTPPAPVTPTDPIIQHSEQLEIVRLIKEKGIERINYLEFLEAELGIAGTAQIKSKDYTKVMEWILRNAKSAAEVKA